MTLSGYDYIIIGAGSAGCVLASRLTEDPAIRVLLLEAGGKNAGLLVRMPAGVAALIDKAGPSTWGFYTEPEPHLDGRRIWWPRGKGLGGSSSINGMVYTRGHPHDFDEWRQLGLQGWAFADVLPYFKRMERHHRGDSEHHGGYGPLRVSGGESDSTFHDAFIAAGQQAGYPATDDFNGAQQEGFGRYDLTIDQGRRWSTATAYLAPALARPNLICVTGAHITRIAVERGRAVAVHYVEGKGQIAQVAHADGEVLVCAGAVQSPHILQLSGIGAADTLRGHDVGPVHDLPGVGENLQDHLDVVLSWRSRDLATVHSVTKGFGAINLALRYALTGQGPGRQQFLESGAFIRTHKDLDRPDLQLHSVLAILTAHDEPRVKADGFSVHVCQLRPESRGSVRLGDGDPLKPAKIFANYLATDGDRRALREGVKLVREIVGQTALDAMRDEPVQPTDDVRTDAEIDAWVRRRAATLYHPVGTCRMGRDGDQGAVVDDALRVHGLEGLRVVDASVMPTLVGSNTNAATIMIAEKAADLIRGRTLPRAES